MAEQAAPEEPRHLHVGPIDQRRGTNDAYLDLSARRRFSHKSLGFTLAPRVWAESLRLFREKGIPLPLDTTEIAHA